MRVDLEAAERVDNSRDEPVKVSILLASLSLYGKNGTKFCIPINLKLHVDQIK